MPRVVQIRTSGAAGYTQHLADLRVRKALDIMQHNYRARPIRKPGERGLQTLPQLVAFSRISESARHCIRELLRASDLAATSEIESCIGDDPIKPGTECLRRIESIQRLMGAQESFLHRIFGIFVRQDDRARNRVRPSLMLPDQSGETPLVPSLCKANELSFLIRNTDGRVGLLGGLTRLPRALIVCHGSGTVGVGVDACQRDV